ncbi:MAG: hypothetical protein E7022_04355 [Desulfovibrio desulfuricans]|nr:hypothetical protein [Desulfovibrio desulfuricans]
MAFWNVKKKRRIELLSETLYYSLENHLNKHYYFRYSDSYKGIYGRLAAYFDAIEAQEQEEKDTIAHYNAKEYVYHSDYNAKEVFEAMRLDDEKRKIENSFATGLMRLINEKNEDNANVYKRALIDRKLFSKIISSHDYYPSKKTILALAIALKLDKEETQSLLKRAGFTLSDNILSDVIIGYFIDNGIYDIAEINKALLAYDQKLLGSS